MSASAATSFSGSVPRRLPRWAGVALLALVGAAFAGYWIWTAGAEGRAIQAMPIAERRAFFDRTVENLKTVCTGEEAAELKEFCDHEAERVLLFPDCDAECRGLAKRQLAEPSR